MILISNGEILCVEWNEDLKVSEVKPISSDINYYYNDEVSFKNLTFEGLFDAIYPWFFILERDFISYTKGIKIQDFYNQLKSKTESIENKFTAIEFYYISNISCHRNLMDNIKTKNVDSMIRFHALSKDRKEPDYSLAFINLNKIKHLPVVLKEKYDIWYMDPEMDNYKQLRIADDLTHVYTLHEILSAFLLELTYFGSPKDIKVFEDTVLNKFEEITAEQLLNAEPAENLLIKFLEDDLKIAQETENYEACRRIQDKIDQYVKERDIDKQ